MVDNEMDAEHEHDQEAWLRERYPAASGDFVQDTLAKVMADRRQIEAEATKVDDFQFEPEFLAHLEPPAPNENFVEATLAAVMAQRRERQTHDGVLRDLLAKHQLPPISANFVERTLAALTIRPARSAGPRSTRTRSVRKRATIWAAAAALLLAIPLGLLYWGGANVAPTPSSIDSAGAFTAVRWGTAMAAREGRGTTDMAPITLGDGLLTLAAMGSR